MLCRVNCYVNKFDGETYNIFQNLQGNIFSQNAFFLKKVIEQEFWQLKTLKLVQSDITPFETNSKSHPHCHAATDNLTL